MKVSGAADVRASQDALWAALTNPRLLARAVPGLDQIDFADDGTCQFILTTTIAAVRGSYAGQARVVSRDAPGACVLRVSAAGVKGTVNADVTLRLAPAADEVTQLSYTADAAVDGAIAGIGQLMLASIARRIAAETISGLDEALAAPAPADPPAAIADHATDVTDRRRADLSGPAVASPAPAVR
ncbi:MAG TPA: SRPBCC domain-containing protein, partial [Streptosporangiaceae bacterium]|nr:SRPBCC domain-containing protein [Streptosporangiaceae bacterium]